MAGSPTSFPLPPKLARWWRDECLPRLDGRVDLAIPVALLRGLRWWILPYLPRDADWVAQDARNRAWDRRIARRGVVTAPHHAAPRQTATLAAWAADFIHEVAPGGAFCVTRRPEPGQPGPPVCVCGGVALIWREGDPVVPNLSQLALRLATPLTQAVLQKQGPRVTNAAGTLAVIVQALLWMYVELMKDWAAHSRDPLAVRVARRCAAPMILPNKRGHRSRIVGEEFEWWLVEIHALVRRVMRTAFPGQQWATTGRTPGKHARLARLCATWSTLPDAVLKAVSQEDLRGEAERRLTAAVAETLAGVPAAPEAVRRAPGRHRDQLHRFDAADRAGDPE